MKSLTGLYPILLYFMPFLWMFVLLPQCGSSISHSSADHLPKVHFSESISARCESVLSYTRNASRIYQIELEILLAIMKVESNFRPDAKSSCGAQGIMQIMPQVGRKFGLSHPFDPQQNIMVGAAILRKMINRFNGNLIYGLAAYHAGYRDVDKAWKKNELPKNYGYVKKIFAVREFLAQHGCGGP